MSGEPDPSLTGGCACGAVRYRLDGPPFDAGYCHCRTCRAASGAPVLVFATVQRDQFVVTRGALARWRSSEIGQRTFCAGCGTQLTMEMDDKPDEVDFTVASLDTPEAVVPRFHIWARSRIPWFEVADEWPRYPRGRSDAEEA